MLLLAVGLASSGAAAQEREFWACNHVSSDGRSFATKLTVSATTINELVDNPSRLQEWNYNIIINNSSVLAAVAPGTRGFTFMLIDRATGATQSGMIETEIRPGGTLKGKCVRE